MKNNLNATLKSLLIAVAITIVVAGTAAAQQTTPKRVTAQEQKVIDLSKQKWLWMSERKTDELDRLFNDKAVFVHMGGTMSKATELGIIKSGGIQYKTAEIQEVSVAIVDKTAILLNKIKLTAIVGGNEVINPFVVTEVYVLQKGEWKLASVSFTKLLTPEPPK